MKIIVDSNIIFSSLLSSSNKYIETIYQSGHQFFSPYFAYVELFKYKEKILKYSKMNEPALLEQLYLILKNITFVKEAMINDDNLKRAYGLCKDIDEKDILFVSLTFELEGLLWTGDKKLKSGLLEKNFTQFFDI
jgi:predicted nucleic acid-binding protein